jgi:hypothetical protein
VTSFIVILCKFDLITHAYVSQVTVDIYIKVLLGLVQDNGFEVFVHPIAPVLNETREIVMQYNAILQKVINHVQEEFADCFTYPKLPRGRALYLPSLFKTG